MSISTKLARRAAAIALVGGAGAVALGAAPAFASSSPAQATVTVQQNISFSFVGSPSFSLNPGQTSTDAIGFTIATNAYHGYTVSLSAPDLTGPGAPIPAGDLTYDTSKAGVGQLYTPVSLSNTAAQIASSNAATNGDNFTQDWTANIPANTPPGSYTTTLTYVAVGTP